MSPRLSSAFACVLALAPAPITGFAPSSIITTHTINTITTNTHTTNTDTAPLHMSSITEDMYPRLMNSASICARSDDDACSVDDAESYLREIVHIQSGCAAGTLSGNAVCDDVLTASEVVADLRRKIGEGAEREVRTFWDKRQEELETLAAASDGSSAAALAAPIKPAYLALAALYAIFAISVLQPATDATTSGGVVPFAAREVWWAIRDGYAGDLAAHFFRNGGLVASDASSPVAGSVLSPQEFLWSVRDGYAENTMLASGGVVGGGGGVESVPFAPREVWWAVENGYAGDMIAHWFRNGGLSM